jgi:hypothetical protein
MRTACRVLNPNLEIQAKLRGRARALVGNFVSSYARRKGGEDSAVSVRTVE